MVTYTKAHEGKRFVLTAHGFDNPRIRAKFDKTNMRNYRHSKYTVPTKWVEENYVQEVDDVEE